MPIKLKGLNATLSTFREVDRRFREAAAEEIELGAKRIAALARMYAPQDTGALMKSIRAQRVHDGRATRWRIKVGGTIGGRDVTEYALAVHEGYSTNRPSWSLGRKSREKAARLGVSVGPRYLLRAYRLLVGGIRERVSTALNAEASEIGRRRK